MKNISNKEKIEIERQKLETELETIKNVCDAYKKNKAFNLQILLTIIEILFFYCQQYVLRNNIDIGLEISFIKYIGIAIIFAFLLGWGNYIVEFHISNFNLSKILQCIIWIIEIILIIIFLIFLF